MNKSMLTLSGRLSTVALMMAQVMTTPGLVPVFGLHIDSDPNDTAVMNVTGLLDDFDLAEDARIDAVRAWAVAVNGRLNLDEPHVAHQSTTTFRRLTAIADLPGGGRFQVFTFIARTEVTARLTTTGDLVAA